MSDSPTPASESDEPVFEVVEGPASTPSGSESDEPVFEIVEDPASTKPAPESDEPVFEIVEEPAAQPAAALPATARHARLRRVWRWTRKWGKRTLLLTLCLGLLASVVYFIHRQSAFDASDRALAEVRAELDANEPGWRYEDIEAAYNATLPPADKNSFTLIAQFPPQSNRTAQPKGVAGRRGMTAEEMEVELFLDSLGQSPSNKLPAPRVRQFVDSARSELPSTHPVVVELTRSTTGGIRMVKTHQLPDPEWADVVAAVQAGLRFEIAAVSAAAARDDKAVAVYALASINAGRVIGDMPRTLAQSRRAFAARRAVRILERALAWGEPAMLEDVQREMHAEAQRDWVAMALRGERAVLNRSVAQFTLDDEIAHRLRLFDDQDRYARSLEGRTVIFLARPYREECRAAGLRAVTQAIALCKLPALERIPALVKADTEFTRELREGSKFYRFWALDLSVTTLPALKAECDSRAHMLTGVAAIACERFRRQHKRWPDSLAEIPTSILPSVPTDPFDGKPLRYLRLDDGVVVYSVGDNLRDDWGELGLPDYGPPLDIGVRLWNPAIRGLPPKDPLTRQKGPADDGPP